MIYNFKHYVLLREGGPEVMAAVIPHLLSPPPFLVLVIYIQL